MSDDPAGLARFRAAARVAQAERELGMSDYPPRTLAQAHEGHMSNYSDDGVGSGDDKGDEHGGSSSSDDDEDDESVSTSCTAPPALTGTAAHAAQHPQFPPPVPHSPSESAEERAFALDLAALDPTSLSDKQKRCICNAVACCLPRAPPPLATAHTNIGSEAHIQAQLGMPSGPDSGGAAGDDPASSCPVPSTWELRFLLLLLQYFSLDPLTLVALQPLLGSGVDPSPFLAELGCGDASFAQRMRVVLILLHFSVVSLGGYDARVRALLRTLCQPALLNIRWSLFCRQENRYALLLAAQAEKARLEAHARKRASRSATAKKWLKVGAAGTVAGALLFVTGGLAAPAIGAGLASLGIGGLAGGGIFIASSAGVILVATLFGATGAGLIGYKLNRRISSLQEFRFERLSGVAQGVEKVAPSTGGHQCLSVQLCINGWLTSNEDYHSVWAPLVPGRVVCAALGPGEEEDDMGRAKNSKSNSRSSGSSAAGSNSQVGQTGMTAGQLLRKEGDQLERMRTGASTPSSNSSPTTNSAFYTPGLAEHSEVYTLRWESDCLRRFGSGLKDITGAEVASTVASAGLQQTALKGLVLAIAWPVTLLQAGDLIDHPWLVVLDRCAKAAIELANALEARLAGRRPITIVAYSMGARVVFLALEELWRRKKNRARIRAEASQAARAEATAASAASAAASAFASNSSVAPPRPASPSFFDKLKISDKSKRSSGHITDPNLPTGNALDAAAKQKAEEKKSNSAGSGPGSASDPTIEDADGAILDVFLFGCPVPAELVRWRRVRSMVSGRLVNGYCRRDWALRFIYPLTTASAQVAGLMPIADKKTRMAQQAAQARAAAAVRARAQEAQQARYEAGLREMAMRNQASEGAAVELEEIVPVRREAPPVPPRPATIDIPSDTTQQGQPPAIPPRPASLSLSSSTQPPLHPSQPGVTTSTAAVGPTAVVDGDTPVDDTDEWDMLMGGSAVGEGTDTDDEGSVATDNASSNEMDVDAEALEQLVRPMEGEDTIGGGSDGTSTAGSTPLASPTRQVPGNSRSFSSMSVADVPAGASASSTRSPRARRSAASSSPRLPLLRYCGIESVDCTSLVKGHKDYPHKIEVLLRACAYQP